MALLQALAVIGILVQLPYWFLMIVLPQHPLTRRLTSNYLIFAALGIIFIFIVVGLITYTASLGGTLSSALASVPADAKDFSADTLKPLTAALTTAQNSLPIWLIVGLLCGFMDLAGGFLIYQETQRRGTARGTASAFLLLMLLLGPIGMMIFALWHYLAAPKAASGSPVE
jgi:hypothetical protein